ncbi:MAG TPA: ABC transporter permease [Candidatus Acidoferrales bacterium]|jgi:predicted permease|nr:ABC transporter permease [Candidatus Acidoferrales bacterium]
MEWLRRVWYLLNRRRLERELADEMAFHREMMAREGRSGFGSSMRLGEDARQVWGTVWLDRLWQDLVYGLRVLHKSAGFTATAVLVLGLGIGVELTVFRLVLGELKPPSVPDPDSFVALTRSAPGSNSTLVPYPQFAFYRDQAQLFQSVFASSSDTVALGETPAGGAAEPVPAEFITAGYFSKTGAHALYGRLLDAHEDERPDSECAALLSQRFWQRRFGGDLSLIGRTVKLNGKPVRIVGVLPPGLRGLNGRRVSIWLPMAKQPYVVEGSKLLTDWGSGIWMHARLKPGVAPEASEAETRALAARLRADWPKQIWKGEWLTATPVNRLETRSIGIMLLTASLVLLVLVVACANLGTLLLARGAVRDREIRIRMALGAARRRVVRQLLTESLLLAVMGSLAALALSSIAIKVVQAQSETPDELSVAPDWRVLAATMGIAILAAAVFGLAPALRLTSPTASEHRRGGGSRARTVFLAVQVGPSCVLLMVSGLLMRGLQRLVTQGPGFDYRQVVWIDPGLRAHGYDAASARPYVEALRQRVRAIPGVQRVSLAWLPPWGHRVSGVNEHGHQVRLNHVDEEYLRTMGIQLLRGRTFRPGEQGVALVSEALASWQWPAADPLGKNLTVGDPAVVVGVFASVNTSGVENTGVMEIYYPLVKEWAEAVVVARVAGRPANYARALEDATSALDRKLRPQAQLLEAEYQRVVANGGRMAAGISLLGTVALLLAAIGAGRTHRLYGGATDAGDRRADRFGSGNGTGGKGGAGAAGQASGRRVRVWHAGFGGHGCGVAPRDLWAESAGPDRIPGGAGILFGGAGAGHAGAGAARAAGAAERSAAARMKETALWGRLLICEPVT